MTRALPSIIVCISLLALAGAQPPSGDRRAGGVSPLVAQTANAAAPKVLELRVQKVGPTTYFHVRLEVPADMKMPGGDGRMRQWSAWDIARLPRLVPQDDRTRAVYLCMADDREGQPLPDMKIAPMPAPPVVPQIKQPPAKVLPPPNPVDDPPLTDPKKVPAPEPPKKSSSNTFSRDATYSERSAHTRGLPMSPTHAFEYESMAPNAWSRCLQLSPTHAFEYESMAPSFVQAPAPNAEPIAPPVRIVPATKKVIVVEHVQYTVIKKVRITLPDGKTVFRDVPETRVKEVRREVQVPVGGAKAIPNDAVPDPLHLESLEFVGKVHDNGSAKLLLLYPTQPAGDPKAKKSLTEMFKDQGAWTEVPITLDFAKAQKVKLPPSAAKRHKEPNWPEHDDLEGQWAASQARYFALLETLTDDFGFYSFARELTGQKYAVPALAMDQSPNVQELIVNRLYEITTGAAAITETLALHRLRQVEPRNKDEGRSVEIGKVQGIDIPAHPWEKMLAGKKPSPEPLAKLVPFDNYYLHFKNIARFLETGDILDQWGTTLARALEVQSRDYQVKERLEQQLCLKSNKLTRILGPAVVKSLAITGSDPYLREGSDFTMIFHVTNPKLFLTAVEPHLLEARKAHPGKLKEEKHEYQGIATESFTTPLREVSLHRAAFDDFVVYSNSPVGLRRVIDAHRGRVRSLAESLDFRYMRTVFRLEDPLEDGFLFISDAFVRNLVGPATRIKERRRLEGMTSLYMVTHGALFTAWETGKLPNHHNQLLAATGIKPEQLVSPDGDAAFWNAEHKLAFSTAYNTLNFATPLIEMPIDKVTPTEQAEYEQFRQQYLGIWRQYIDPIGIRISLGEPGASATGGNQIRWETFILPLVQTSQYNELRRLTGDGTVKLDPRTFNDKTVAQFLAHLAPAAQERKEFGKFLSGLSRDIPGLNWLGDWFTVRLDDSPVYGKLVEQMIRRELDPRLSSKNLDEDVRLLSQLPLTMGVEIRNPLVFAGVLATVKRATTDVLPGVIDWEPIKEPYKGTTIVKIQVRPEAALNAAFGNRRGEPITPGLYYALIDGAWWISFREECIHDEIDAAHRRQQGPKTDEAKIDVNASLYVNPKAGANTREFLNFYLEWETHRRAIANAHLLYPLFHGGIISPADHGATIQNAALKYLGFIPVSPDFSPYMYESKTDEIVNQRHGSLRRPLLHPGIDKGSPLDQVLEQIRSVRADMRFREDGLHSVITFRRK